MLHKSNSEKMPVYQFSLKLGEKRASKVMNYVLSRLGYLGCICVADRMGQA